MEYYFLAGNFIQVKFYFCIISKRMKKILI